MWIIVLLQRQEGANAGQTLGTGDGTARLEVVPATATKGLGEGMKDKEVSTADSRQAVELEFISYPLQLSIASSSHPITIRVVVHLECLLFF